jgi:hypothetical protein
MKLTTTLPLVLACFLSACNENQPPKAQAPETRQNALMQALQQGQTTYSSNIANGSQAPARHEMQIPNSEMSLPGVAKASAEPVVRIPQGARWSLYCTSVAGPDRIAKMTQIKAYLLAKSPFKDWYVVHNEQQSTLCYGFYSSIEKGDRDGARAHADREKIAGWADEMGDRPFASCFFTPITPPSPPAPEEWNLANAPARAYWSVQIAAFKDNAERKQAAVQMVQELRNKGVDAYYYHGPSMSLVCIGTWPADAVKQQDTDGNKAIADPDDAMLVTSTPLPSRYQGAKMKTKDGQRLVPYAERIEILDKSLSATFKEYPYNYVNYEAQAKQVKTAEGKIETQIAPSLLVRVPREDLGAGAPGTGSGGLFNQTGAPPVDSTRQQPAGTSRLRGLGF